MNLSRPVFQHESAAHAKTIYWIAVFVILVLCDMTAATSWLDTGYYLLAAKNFLNGHIDCLRTPVYPLFLELNKMLFGEDHYTTGVVVMQSLVYICSAAAFYALCHKLIHNRPFRCIILALYIVLVPTWCNEILTESLSISGCVILSYAVVKNIEHPSLSRSLWITLGVVILLFLRPTFIVFLAILPALWLYLAVKEKKKLYTASLLLSILPLVCYIGYVNAYANEWGVRSMTISHEFNLYDLMRSGCWNVNAVTDVKAKAMCEQIESRYEGSYAPLYDMIAKEGDMSLLQTAFQEMTAANSDKLLRYRVENQIISYGDRFNFEKYFAGAGVCSYLFYVLSILLSPPVSLYFLCMLAGLLFLCVYVFTHKKIPLIQTFVFSVAFAQYVGISMSASESFGRLLLPVFPLFLLLLGIGADFFLHYARSKED